MLGPAKAGFFSCMKQIITITTDFGDGFATSQLKVIVAGLGYDGYLVENDN